LYLNNGKDNDYNRELTGKDLASLLKYSRVAAIAFGSPAELDTDIYPDVMWTYRAFTALGYTSYRLPAIVAPLGPLDLDRSAAFWTAYYKSISGDSPISSAASTASKDIGNIAVAVSSGRRALRGLAPVASYPRGYTSVVAQRLTLEEIVERATSEAPDYPVWRELLPTELLAQPRQPDQLGKWRNDSKLITPINQGLQEVALAHMRTQTITRLVTALEEISGQSEGLLADIRNQLAIHLRDAPQGRAKQ
jgi:hypothetical protein